MKFTKQAAAFFACTAALLNASCNDKEFRKAPLLETETLSTLRAADFGAIPNDGKSDFEAFKKAFEALEKAGKNTRLEFAKGVYNLKDETSKDNEKYLFTVKNLKDCEIDAQDSTFIIENPNFCLIDLLHSERVIFKNITIDYNPVPWTECTVEKVDVAERKLTVKVRDGFEGFEHPMFTAWPTDLSFWGYQLDPNVPGRLKFGVNRHNMVKGVKKLADKVYELTFTGTFGTQEAPKYEVGDKMGILARRSNKMSLFLVEYSIDVSFIDITAYATPSFFFKSLHSQFMNFIRCDGLIKPGRWRGGDADFIHLQNNKNGPWIEGCTVEGIADDSLVFYTRPFYVLETSEDGLKMKLGRAIWPKGAEALLEGDITVGDPLLFLNPVTGGVIARVKVVSYDAKNAVITLSAPVKLAPEELGTVQTKTQIFNEAFSRNFVVKNNTVRNSRRFGMYWKASHGLVEGNTFEGLSSDAITLHNEAAAPNGPFCDDVIIRNNTIRHCGFDAPFMSEESSASISVYSRPAQGSTLSKAENCFNNIAIIDNVIEDWNIRAIQVRNTDGALIKGNKIGGVFKGGTDKSGGKKILVGASQNVKVQE